MPASSLAATDAIRTYRLAARRLIEIKSNAQVKVAEQDQSDDFSREEPAVSEQTVGAAKLNADEWTQRMRQWSARLASNPAVLNSQIVLLIRRETKYLVSTEGTRLQHGRTFASLGITSQGKASDGMDLGAFQNFQASEAGRLPKPEAIEASIDDMNAHLTKLLQAPIVEPFIGPAILSGGASGVFFHSAESLQGFIQESIRPGTVVHTDGWRGYSGLNTKGYVHEVTILKGNEEPADELLPRVHRITSLLKRWLMGTHQGAVSHKHLDYYLDEFTFRFNRPKSASRQPVLSSGAAGGRSRTVNLRHDCSANPSFQGKNQNYKL